MRSLKRGALVALAVVAVSAIFASSAAATPSKTSRCNGCHTGPNVAVSATQLSVAGTTVTYRVNAAGADLVSVFDGTVKLANVIPGGQFSVTAGKTYTLYAVAGPGDADGIGITTVSPVAAPADTTAPVTTSNAQSSYVSLAAITLTATDAGSGVATTYYRLDGGAQTAGTSVAVNALGSHTLQFWSVDKAGNVEAAKTVTFTVTAPVPVDTTAPVTTSDAVASYVSSAAIKLTATDAGSGVATTYYRLDGGAQTAGTSVAVSAVGAHTLQFWSVDKAGNVEAAKTVTFTVTAPVPSAEQTETTLSLRAGVRKARVNRPIPLLGVLKPAQGGEVIGLYVLTPGSSTWTLVTEQPTLSFARFFALADRDDDDDDDDDDDERPVFTSTRTSFSYSYKPATRGTYKFQLRFAGDADSAPVVSRTLKVSVR